MKTVAWVALAAALPLSVLAREKPRPQILEILQVRIRTNNEKEANNFYNGALRALFPGTSSAQPCDWCERMPPVAQKLIEFDPIKGPTQAADQQLLESNLHLPLDEVPKIGRDGKWQLNLYDPDGTRVELMEFTPVEKPCCSDYTGPHPRP
jgi:hypothetical protein